MFDLDQCIDVTFDRLDKIIKTVDVKFTQFSNIASTVINPKEVSNVIRASDVQQASAHGLRAGSFSF